MKKGFKHSEEARKKIKIARAKQICSEETKRKISLAQKGHSVSEETRKKISEAHKRIGSKPPSPLGRILSEEHKRKLSEAHKGNKNTLGKHWKLSDETKQRGKKHWNWKGGKLLEPYTIDWTGTLRQSIRERDRYTCQLCGKKQGDMTHSVHHIDYNKKNCNPNNLITLCNGCHQKTNFKRNYWQNLFYNLFNQ